MDRTPRGTTLTEAGDVFLPRARALLRSAAQAAAYARAAAEPSRVTIGHTTGLDVTPAVRELCHRYPDADVRTRHVAWNEPQTALVERRVDAVVARLPFPTGKLDMTALYDPGRTRFPGPPAGRERVGHARRHRRRARSYLTSCDQ